MSFVICEHGPHIRHAQALKFAIPFPGARVVGPTVLEGKPMRFHRDLLFQIRLPRICGPVQAKRKIGRREIARGKVLAEQSLASLWLDVHVSESTDTKDEKAVPIGNGEFTERPASTKTACPSDWTPYDFPTLTVAGEVRGDAHGDLPMWAAKHNCRRRACDGDGLQLHAMPKAFGKCIFSLVRWSSEQVTNRLGDSSTFTRKGASGGNVHCVFCPRCGSTVSTSLELFPGLIGIPVGCFADPSFPTPQVAAWCDSKFGWVRFPEGLVLLRDQSRPMEVTG